MNSVAELLEQAARRWPEKTAVCDEWESLSFAAWRDRSRCTAAALLRAGLGRAPVIVCMKKSACALTAFLGVAYAGGVYAPADANIPLPRLEKIVRNLSPACILTDRETAPRLAQSAAGVPVLCMEELASAPDDDAVDAALAEVVDTDPVYIMYTSGSTGAPKGVTIAHRGVTDYAEWVVSTFGFDGDTVMGNQAPFYFDNSVFDIYGCLASGARLELIPEALFLFPLKLPEFLEEKEITSVFWVPTVMINVANSGALERYPLRKLKNVAFCGEVMPNTQLNIWRRTHPHCRYANLYGPTEITDVCCWYEVDRPFEDHEPLPIGRACRNTRILILNEKDELAAPGEQGEICVAGAGVALGYWNAPELTARAFVQNPLHSNYRDVLYRTGDLGCVDERGEIQFFGRRDSQIKLKGNRIELGEIESAAMCVEGVENACAVFDAGRQEIALFVETAGTLPARRFNLELKRYIPSYMLPARLLPMEKLPHTPNDKIDRVKLRGMLQEV